MYSISKVDALLLDHQRAADRQRVDGADVFPDQPQEEELDRTHEEQPDHGWRQTIACLYFASLSVLLLARAASIAYNLSLVPPISSGTVPQIAPLPFLTTFNSFGITPLRAQEFVEHPIVRRCGKLD